jgi:Putative porin
MPMNLSLAPTPLRKRLRHSIAALAGCLVFAHAHADERAELDSLRATTIALIQALVDQGLISADRAQALVRQAGARAPATAAAAPATAASAAEWGQTRPNTTVRVPYIPETLKAQIKEDIKLDVLATARDEGWADSRKLPPWLKTFNFEGDIRVREETALLASTNTPASLYRSQVESPAWSPDLTNTQINRSRLTLRARFGFTANVSDDVSGALRLSTGTSPTSGSQTLGASPGFFNRYTIGLDRASIRWEPWQDFSVTGGRMAVPFVGTDLIWPDDLSLDGVAVHAERNLATGLYAFANVGAFALQELELTASDKWLFGVQLGADWALADKTNLRVGAAVYDFRNIEGVRETSPAPAGALAGTVPYYSSEYRAGARLRGNTLINLNDPTNTGAPVWGLASKFRPINVTAALTLDQFDPVRVGVTIDYVKNSAFDLADIQQRAGTPAVADLANKTTGIQARFQIGSRALGERGTWSSFFALRRFDRDAWVDALTDTTWNLGGTSYKGYSLGGSYAFDRRSTIGLRWTSTRNLDDGRRFLSIPGDPTSLSGNLSSAPLKIDVIQLEVNSKF